MLSNEFLDVNYILFFKKGVETSKLSNYTKKPISHFSRDLPFKPAEPSYPLLSHHIPKLSHYLPKLSHHIPKLSHYLPKLSHHIPKLSHYLPKLSHNIPKLSHYLPKLSHHIPVPKLSHYLPKLSHTHPKKYNLYDVPFNP
jgi:hypothetical protein